MESNGAELLFAATVQNVRINRKHVQHLGARGARARPQLIASSRRMFRGHLSKAYDSFC